MSSRHVLRDIARFRFYAHNLRLALAKLPSFGRYSFVTLPNLTISWELRLDVGKSTIGTVTNLAWIMSRMKKHVLYLCPCIEMSRLKCAVWEGNLQSNSLIVLWLTEFILNAILELLISKICQADNISAEDVTMFLLKQTSFEWYKLFVFWCELLAVVVAEPEPACPRSTGSPSLSCPRSLGGVFLACWLFWQFSFS